MRLRAGIAVAAMLLGSSGCFNCGCAMPPTNNVIGGAVAGLPGGASLVLQNNGGDNLTISANGKFAFATKLATGASYNVTVLTQPAAPANPCFVLNAKDLVAYNDITDVYVVCNAAASTLAGTVGVPGFTDGTGTAASFNNPSGIAVDSTGNVYVADSGNHLIRKITAAGVVSTLAGIAGVPGAVNGTGTAASFNNPASVAIDSTGNVYVADSGNHLIRKITSAGVVSTLAGTAGVPGAVNGTGSFASFNNPTGVAVDSTGNVYVADSGNNLVRKITAAGIVSTLAGTAGVAGATNGNPGTLNRPFGVAVDAGSQVYIADMNNQLIRLTSAGAGISTVAGKAGVIGSTDGLAVSNGPVATFRSPAAIAVDPTTGNLYIADTGNNLIRLYLASLSSLGAVKVGTYSGIAGSIGSVNGPAQSATFNTPQGIAVDSAGNIYVADSRNHLIRKIAR